MTIQTITIKEYLKKKGINYELAITNYEGENKK